MIKIRYAGKSYTWKEFIELLIFLHDLEEKKKPWLQRVDINKLSFSKGVIEGMLFESKVLKSIKDENKDYELIFKDD